MTPANPAGAEDACDTTPRHISERETARTILGLLLCEPQPWTRAELARELGGQEIATHDVVENLICAGLANREGEAVSASRAARIFEELEP